MLHQKKILFPYHDLIVFKVTKDSFFLNKQDKTTIEQSMFEGCISIAKSLRNYCE